MSEDLHPLEQDKLRAETELMETKRAREELETRKVDLQVTEAERQVDKMLAHPAENNIYTFFGQVGPSSVKSAMKTLGVWSRRKPGEDMTIIFNSPGGQVMSGLALYDFLRELSHTGHHIETVGLGMAASMGGVLLQAGDTRVMGPNAHMLIHEVRAGAIGHTSALEDELEFIHSLQKRLLAILAREANLTADEIGERWKRKDWWLDADEALELGFVDEVRSPTSA